ncbi:hypothetical protein ONE63_011453 [Megalurothrips usitatus]|uniref:OSK domain-containing protein n=1 Tax=Megalurothrips usitatus TaxID=439358 RepID=A0AAV7WZY1_9NEOP|nr:hypothetical protein ONE63_011453 [Megalurothrips usitatus]
MDSKSKVLVMLMEESSALKMLQGQLQPARGRGGHGGGERSGRGGHSRGGRGRGGRGRGSDGRDRQGGHRVQGGRIQKRQPRRGLEEDESVAVPLWNDFQLIGDSIMSRLARRCCPSSTPVFNAQSHTRQLGAIVHGQTVSQLGHVLSKPKRPALHNQGIMLIGTNDLIKKVPLESTKQGLEKVIENLCSQMEKLILMTVPPIPRQAEKDAKHLESVRALNECIKSVAAAANDKLQPTQRVFVLETEKCFVDSQDNIKNHLYERVFPSGDVDKIHPNADGLRCLENEIEKFITQLPQNMD